VLRVGAVADAGANIQARGDASPTRRGPSGLLAWAVTNHLFGVSRPRIEHEPCGMGLLNLE